MSQKLPTSIDWQLAARQRLDSVVISLLALQEVPCGTEALHEVRVACRRAEAMLRICRDLLPARHVTWLRTELRRLRRAVNAARDREVSIVWLKDKKGRSVRRLHMRLRDQQQLDHAAAAKMAKSLSRSSQFERHLKRASKPFSGPKGISAWRATMAQRLMGEFAHFMHALPDDVSNSRQLHRLRIASKRLRYAYEFVAEVITESRSPVLEQLLHEMQDRLGQLNDVVVRRKTFRRLGAESSHLPNLDQESAELLMAWQDWWSSIALDEPLQQAIASTLRLALGTSNRSRNGPVLVSQ